MDFSKNTSERKRGSKEDAKVNRLELRLSLKEYQKITKLAEKENVKKLVKRSAQCR